MPKIVNSGGKLKLVKTEEEVHLEHTPAISEAKDAFIECLAIGTDEEIAEAKKKLGYLLRRRNSELSEVTKYN